MIKIICTTIITLSILLLLTWQHFHGGVPSHHILQQKDLPEISNWWGDLFLPIISWLLISRIESRKNGRELLSQKNTFRILVLFVFGFILGITIAFSFVNNYKLFLDNVPYTLLLLGLFIPIFYSEFILGFIFGMVYHFGTILPSIFILIFALSGFLIYRYIRPLIFRVLNTQSFKNTK